MKIDPFVYEKILDSLWTNEKGAWWDYAVSIQDRFDESIYPLEELKGFIVELVPNVIFETPASLSEKYFIEK